MYIVILPLLFVILFCTLSVHAYKSSKLLSSKDLIYKGAFAYPSGDEWAYSGQAMAYYPNGDASGGSDGYPGSLYVAGSRNDETGDLVGEINIPVPVDTENFADLPKASLLQPLTDITGGWKDNCSYNDECIYRNIDGLAYLSKVDKIAWNLKDWYNVAAYDQDSLGWSDLDMSHAQGVWHIGTRGNQLFHNAKACNYLFKAPKSFAVDHLGGKRLIAGNSREAGALGGSQGPTLYALAPWQDGSPPTPGQNLNALALLFYREIISCVWEDPECTNINEIPVEGVCDFPNYRAFDHWNGGAWIDAGGKSAIVIVGRKGMGANCYGTQEKCSNDPCDMYKGYHAYPYEPQMLFYNPKALLGVLAENEDPWTITPEETYSLTDVAFNADCAEPGSAAYDIQRNILYVAEQDAGPYGETAVHVWSVSERNTPILDIQVNGSDGPIHISSSDSIDVTIGLNPGNQKGLNADWWLAIRTPSGWRSLAVRQGKLSWIKGIERCIKAGLVQFDSVSIPAPTLSEGNNYIYFVIDNNADGIPNVTWYDYAEIIVRSEAKSMIIDHTCTDLKRVPEHWINQTKSELRLAYGHTSHGSQPVTGMEVLMDSDSLYAFNTDGSIQPGVLSLADSTPDGDLGHNGDTSWADRTRNYLNGHGSDRNVVVWSWCGGVSDNTQAGISAYLSAMNVLESEYPSVTFVYMTGHLDGTGESGNLHIRNEQIRNYCRENNKVLFDFADIESYDPDGRCYLNLWANDNCDYNYGANNWAQEWCAANVSSALCTDCGYTGCCAHSQPLNCNLKARAFWWMLARITGWEGTK